MTAKKPAPQKSHCNIGPLKRGGAGKHNMPARIVLDTPTRITNSSMRELYVPPFMGRL